MNLVFGQFKFLYQVDKRIYFALLCGINALALYLKQESVLTDEVYFRTLGEQIAFEQLEKALAMRKSNDWMFYSAIPLQLLFKVFLVTICLNIGTLFANYKIGFGRLFKIALWAEGLFVVIELLRMIWFAYFSTVESLFDVRYNYPLSVISFFDAETMASWLRYPLVTLNFFELLFMALIALALHWEVEKPFKTTLLISGASYGIGLLVWLVFILFISLNYVVFL